MDQNHAFHIPSRAEAIAKRRAERDGYAFPLPITGGVARVRRISLAEAAANDALPAPLQAAVLEVFNESTQVNRGQMSWDDARHNIQRQGTLARAMCVAGFVQPRLVESQAEADAANDPNVWWVDDLNRDEQVAYLNFCLRIGTEGATDLVPFPAAGVESLAAVPAREDIRTATLRPVGAEPSGGGQPL